MLFGAESVSLRINLDGLSGSALCNCCAMDFCTFAVVVFSLREDKCVRFSFIHFSFHAQHNATGVKGLSVVRRFAVSSLLPVVYVRRAAPVGCHDGTCWSVLCCPLVAWTCVV